MFIECRKSDAILYDCLVPFYAKNYIYKIIHTGHCMLILWYRYKNWNLCKHLNWILFLLTWKHNFKQNKCGTYALCLGTIYICINTNCVFSQVPVITAMEHKALDLLSRRAERWMERRRQDVRDQAEEVAMQASQ